MGRVVIVTGGTRGIGAAIARVLQADGHAVVSTYLGNDRAAADFRDQTGIPVDKWDVADASACWDGVRSAERKLGPVGILVNNAGITRDAALHRMTLEEWHAVLENNLTSCFNMCRAVIDGMRERGFGRIVNIASINGQKGQAGQTNYAAAKAGVIGFTKALALETAAKGITVNAVAPGYVETDMVAAVPKEILQKIIGHVPVERLGQPEEIARAVQFLASDEAGFVTGATLTINGGQYMV